MLNLSSVPVMLTAAVNILVVFLLITITMRVGSLRGKHNVAAPAVTGHPEFERGYRVQLNTLEQLPGFLICLWLATAYIDAITWLPLAWLPAAIGFIWVIARFMYMQGYVADPSKRSTGFLISGICTILLLLIAIIGLVMTWIAVASGGTASA